MIKNNEKNYTHVGVSPDTPTINVAVYILVVDSYIDSIKPYKPVGGWIFKYL